jgi:glucose-6-phosphate isomerase/transaldolase/glucose-6-phosphate isomerase
MSELLDRIHARDETLWEEGNVASRRLGWIDLPRTMLAEAAELRDWARGVTARHVVLLGMGGSSLGAEVLRASFEDDRLVVLDTTDPSTVAAAPLDDAFFLVSSKSGTTLEVSVLLARCWEAVPVPSRYADRGFARTFLNPSDIGGRYSVLSYFGLVPAALMDLDIEGLCRAALTADQEGAVTLGTAMATAALEGRDKLTVVVPPAFRSFGLWVEQLIAESTGKHGRGCIPVPTSEVEHGDDRHTVLLDLEDPVELGRELYRWQLATAAAGHALAIDPFDEPNVSESKSNTLHVLEHLPLPAVEPADAGAVSTWLKEEVRPGDYVSIQAYLPFGQDEALERLRRAVRDGLGGMAVTAGYGPRFLHSTGQLHKGGPNTVVAVQVLPRAPTAHVPIPGFPYDLATLIEAQALGDLQSLHNHGRRVLRVEVDGLDDIR